LAAPGRVVISLPLIVLSSLVWLPPILNCPNSTPNPKPKCPSYPLDPIPTDTDASAFNPSVIVPNIVIGAPSGPALLEATSVVTTLPSLPETLPPNCE
jgi:hypothetical protein